LKKERVFLRLILKIGDENIEENNDVDNTVLISHDVLISNLGDPLSSIV
jgi:hypothetical protein